MLASGDILPSVAAGAGLTAVAILWVIFLVRVTGHRSLAKMTGFDFVTTIAIGSLIANAGTSKNWSEYGQALAAIAGLFLLQWLLAKARVRSTTVQNLLGNQPVLLMEHGRFVDDAMTSERIARADIYAKMRESGVQNPDEVRAVVLERTGDISIIKEGPLEGAIFNDVAGGEIEGSKQG